MTSKKAESNKKKRNKQEFPCLKEIDKLTTQLEAKRGSTIIPLLFTKSISRPLVSEIYDFLFNVKKLEKCEKLEIILHSGGGDIDAAYHLGKMLRSFASKQFNVIVPRFAKSAGTLLACAGDVIVMERPSELGSLEPLIEMSTGEEFSPLSIDELIEFLDNIEKRLGGSSRILEIIANRLPIMQIGDCLKSIKYAEPLLRELLMNGMFKNDTFKEKKVDRICRRLIYEYPLKGHGYVIDMYEAKKIGLKIENPPRDQWEIIWRIFRIFEKEFLL